MAKKTSASSRREKLVVKSDADIRAYAQSPAFKRAMARIKRIRDEDIDYSDMPELTDEELDRMVRARAARLKALKRPISIRLEPDVLQWLKSSGPGYQTRINALLREAMQRTKQAGRSGYRVLQSLLPQEPETMKLGYATKRKAASTTMSFRRRRPKPPNARSLASSRRGRGE